MVNKYQTWAIEFETLMRTTLKVDKDEDEFKWANADTIALHPFKSMKSAMEFRFKDNVDVYEELLSKFIGFEESTLREIMEKDEEKAKEIKEEFVRLMKY